MESLPLKLGAHHTYLRTQRFLAAFGRIQERPKALDLSNKLRKTAQREDEPVADGATHEAVIEAIDRATEAGANDGLWLGDTMRFLGGTHDSGQIVR
jgi:hypothetical protein